MSVTMPTRDLDRLSRSGLTAADLENLDEDLAGRAVVDRAGEQIGSVEDELVDPRRLNAPFVLVSWGGMLGIGRQQRLVPTEVVDHVDEEGGVHLGRVREVVTSGPPYADQPDEAEAERHYASVYEHYELTPYWAKGADTPVEATQTDR